MDWDDAIRRNRAALMRFVVALFGVAGLTDAGSAPALPRQVRLRILSVLRPAESALRRLIFVVARVTQLRMVVRAGRGGRPFPEAIRSGDASRIPPFALIDPRKSFSTAPLRRYAASEPTIRFCDQLPVSRPEAKEPSADDLLDSAAVSRRLLAMRHALDDLPKQAKRMLRAMQRREAAPAGPGHVPPLRPGWPPGHRARQIHPVDRLLADCRDLAAHAQAAAPDTG